MNHYRHTRKLYAKRQRSEGCPFCLPEVVAESVYENDTIFVVPNLTQYDLWELHDVEDHLMVIPKRHVESFAELHKSERLAIMDVIADYEAKGYSVYARGVGFAKRSIQHQHTHLIKARNTQPKVALFVQRPYYLFKK